MAQAQVDILNSEPISITQLRQNRVSCRLDISREAIIAKSKGELIIYLKEDSKTVKISATFLEKLLHLSESLQLIVAFVRGN